MSLAVVFLDGTVKNGAAEIMQLKERLWQLEGGVRQAYTALTAVPSGPFLVVLYVIRYTTPDRNAPAWLGWWHRPTEHTAVRTT